MQGSRANTAVIPSLFHLWFTLLHSPCPCSFPLRYHLMKTGLFYLIKFIICSYVTEIKVECSWVSISSLNSDEQMRVMPFKLLKWRQRINAFVLFGVLFRCNYIYIINLNPTIYKAKRRVAFFKPIRIQHYSSMAENNLL